MLNQYRFHAGQFPVLLTEVKLTGEDVVAYLQNQSTFNVHLLSRNSFQLASFLDPQGRVETYGWIVRRKNDYSYLIPKRLTEKTLERLNKFLISEDVILSDPVDINLHLVLGPSSRKYAASDACKGIIFEEEAYLQSKVALDLDIIGSNEVEVWRGLNGWPSFDGSDFLHEILNNLRLYDLSLSSNKGCYPGQETVAKIATGRGAAYAPVLIEIDQRLSSGEITCFEKKIGVAYKSFEWENKKYLSASILRDFRVAGMKIQFSLNGSEHEGRVCYYPLLSGDKKIKAQELYDEAMEHFKQDQLAQAEDKFRQAVRLDPTYADAYESLGVMLGRLERYNEAIELMQELSQIDPKSVLAHTNMSLFLMKLGKIDEAEEQKSQATLKSFQKFGDEAQSKEQEEILKKNKLNEWAQRESMFIQVLEIDPDDTLANYGLGSIAVEKGEWERARVHLEKVIEQDAKYSVAYLALGRAYKGLKRIDDARKVWGEGIKISAAKGDLMPANQMQQEITNLTF